jgi:hypothetical protein
MILNHYKQGDQFIHMKKLIPLLLFVLLAACSTSEPETTPKAVSTNTVTATQIPTTSEDLAPESVSTMSPEVQEYLGKVDQILADIAAAGNELDELFFLAANNPSYLDDEGWLKLANGALNRMAKGADAIDVIAPVPTEAERAHEFFQLAAEELRSVVLYQHEVIQGDFDSAYDVTEHMNAHLNYAEQAFDEIEKLQP